MMLTGEAVAQAEEHRGMDAHSAGKLSRPLGNVNGCANDVGCDDLTR